ncbi:hypothetical protein KAI87_14685 [Myxococcota bacterium]|nr:hypothetical protein [Myxococcota bacterium]
MKLRWLWLIFVLPVGVLSLGACEYESDVGTPCGTSTDPIEDPIQGEDPIVEVVRVQRDEICESFQCITHSGLDPYCSQICTIDAADEDSKSCLSDAECKEPNQCLDGKCRESDCPAGFWCKELQAVGPIAGDLYCISREGCTHNLDCGDTAKVECRKLGCYDSCLDEDTSCTTHSLVCQDLEDMEPCCVSPEGGCLDDGEVCPDSLLEVHPPTSPTAWPMGSVQQHNVCQRKAE